MKKAVSAGSMSLSVGIYFELYNDLTVVVTATV